MSDDLRAAMDAFQRAVLERDTELAETVLDADYALVLVRPSPARMPRARWLEVLREYVVHDYVVEDEVVDTYGDVAAVLSHVRMRATVLGDDRSGSFVISDVWRRRDDGWRIWRRHSSPATAGRLRGT